MMRAELPTASTPTRTLIGRSALLAPLRLLVLVLVLR